MNQIDRCKQIEAVQRFCKDLPDGKEFTVCVLLMKGMKENKELLEFFSLPFDWDGLKWMKDDYKIETRFSPF